MSFAVIAQVPDGGRTWGFGFGDALVRHLEHCCFKTTKKSKGAPPRIRDETQLSVVKRHSVSGSGR